MEKSSSGSLKEKRVSSKKRQIQILVICGHSGRMGKSIRSLFLKSKSRICFISLEEAIQRGSKNSTNFNSEKILGVIDFSSPQGFRDSLSFALKLRVPFLSGTTALTSSDFQRLKKAGKKIPVTWSANFSLGLLFLRTWLQDLPRQGFLEDKKLDLSILDLHHKHKKDSPSGTALTLQKDLQEITGALVSISSVRKGTNRGRHKIKFKVPMEEITVTHQVFSRKIFARGALFVFASLLGQKPRVYTAQELLLSPGPRKIVPEGLTV